MFLHYSQEIHDFKILLSMIIIIKKIYFFLLIHPHLDLEAKAIGMWGPKSLKVAMGKSTPFLMMQKSGVAISVGVSSSVQSYPRGQSRDADDFWNPKGPHRLTN